MRRRAHREGCPRGGVESAALGRRDPHSGGGEGEPGGGPFWVIDKDDKTYFVTFHPAAMIYNKKLDAVFKNDIKKLVKIVKNLKKND